LGLNSNKVLTIDVILQIQLEHKNEGKLMKQIKKSGEVKSKRLSRKEKKIEGKYPAIE